MTLNNLFSLLSKKLAQKGIILRGIRTTYTSLLKEILLQEDKKRVYDISYPNSPEDFYWEKFVWDNGKEKVIIEDYPWRQEYVVNPTSKEQFLVWRPFFQQVINRFTNPTGAEIGVFEGFLTQFVLKYVKPLKYYLIDPHKEYKDRQGGLNFSQKIWDIIAEELKIRFKSFPNVQIIRKTSQDGSLDIPDNSLDFVYIDANHSKEAVFNDIAYWLPKIKQGGLIGGHDYDYEEVVAGVNKFIFENKDKMEFHLGWKLNDWWFMKE